MAITKEIAMKGLGEDPQFKGVSLSVSMYQISEMNILQDLVDCAKLASINASTNLLEELEEYLK